MAAKTKKDRFSKPVILVLDLVTTNSFARKSRPLSETCSIPVDLPETSRQPKHQLDAFEFAQPLGSHLGQQVDVHGTDSGRAARSQLGCSHLPIGGQGPIAVTSTDEIVFA